VTHFPIGLHLAASASLALAALCALAIAADLAFRPQKMWIMNAVWPITALFGSFIWLAFYWRWGRADRKGKAPMWASVAKGASHCGAGCTLGDLTVEWLVVAFPAIVTWFGWPALFAEKTFAVWIPDYLVAFAFGIAFQYWTIVPMRKLSPGQGLFAAVKADFASITAWQIGMYGMMALIQFGWFRAGLGHIAPVASVEFWFAMQLAMLAGFATAFPVNWWLISTGLKERM